MKQKKFFLWLLSLLLLLIGIALWLIVEEQSVNHGELSPPTVLETKRDTPSPVERTMEEAEHHINLILAHSVPFMEGNGTLVDPDIGAVVLSILEGIGDENLAITVRSFCDELPSRSQNRKQSQVQADAFAHYIDTYYPALFVGGMGYGEESVPLAQSNQTQEGTHLEIRLQRIVEEEHLTKNEKVQGY